MAPSPPGQTSAAKQPGGDYLTSKYWARAALPRPGCLAIDPPSPPPPPPLGFSSRRRWRRPSGPNYPLTTAPSCSAVPSAPARLSLGPGPRGGEGRRRGSGAGRGLEAGTQSGRPSARSARRGSPQAGSAAADRGPRRPPRPLQGPGKPPGARRAAPLSRAHGGGRRLLARRAPPPPLQPPPHSGQQDPGRPSPAAAAAAAATEEGPRSPTAHPETRKEGKRSRGPPRQLGFRAEPAGEGGRRRRSLRLDSCPHLRPPLLTGELPGDGGGDATGRWRGHFWPPSSPSPAMSPWAPSKGRLSPHWEEEERR
ncbi:PREDICTED: basic salivary proline-rich protein 2-like, partial [Gekko japonicus]|uniref:Basic salivary proline-rich protein 2-like n=1 Tax=Gekko japonicus TaxID=146911 RepID=A0ABM1KBA2_GEKJA